MRFCGAELKPFWLHVNEQPASSKRQLLVSRPRLFKTAKLIRSSAKRSATTKFLNRSAPAGWVKSIWPSILQRSEEHTSELQSRFDLVCRLLLEKKKKIKQTKYTNKKR